jgi:hypothetical protein
MQSIKIVEPTLITSFDTDSLSVFDHILSIY